MLISHGNQSQWCHKYYVFLILLKLKFNKFASMNNEFENFNFLI